MNYYNLENPAYCEAKGLSKVFGAYANNCPREDILRWDSMQIVGMFT